MFQVNPRRGTIALAHGARPAAPFDPRRTILLVTAAGVTAEEFAADVRSAERATLADVAGAMARTMPGNEPGAGWWVTHTEPEAAPDWLGSLLVAVRLYRDEGGLTYGVYLGRRHYYFHEAGGRLANAEYLHTIPLALSDAIDAGL